MEISINLEVKDWKLFQVHLEKELSRSSKSWINNFFVNMFIWAAIAIAILSLFNSSEGIHWPTASAIFTLFTLLFVVLIFNSIKLKKAFAPSNEGAFVGEHKILFNDKGIKSQGKGYTCTRDWSTVKSIEATDKMIIIYLDTAYALVLPTNKLDDPNKLYQYISDKYKSGKG